MSRSLNMRERCRPAYGNAVLWAQCLDSRPHTRGWASALRGSRLSRPSGVNAVVGCWPTCGDLSGQPAHPFVRVADHILGTQPPEPRLTHDTPSELRRPNFRPDLANGAKLRRP